MKNFMIAADIENFVSFQKSESLYNRFHQLVGSSFHRIFYYL